MEGGTVGIVHLGIGHGAHIDVIIHAEFTEKLGELSCVAERIGVKAYLGSLTEVLMEKMLCIEALPYKGFTAGQVTVGFNPHAACQFPAAFSDTGFDFFKHGGIGLEDPLVETSRASGETNMGVFVHAVEGAAEGGPHFFIAFGPIPEPGGIDVPMADHVEGGVLHGRLF